MPEEQELGTGRPMGVSHLTTAYGTVARGCASNLWNDTCCFDAWATISAGYHHSLVVPEREDYA